MLILHQKIITMKKKGLKVSLLLSGLALLAPVAMTAKNFQTVEILGNQYYVYEVKKGDTLFGIARANGWNDAELQRLNPSAVSPLKKGVKLFYPVDIKSSASVSPETLSSAKAVELTHVIKKGETVYSISMLYGIPVDTIYKLNPDSRNGIKTGEVLKLGEPHAIQEKGTGKHKESVFYVIKEGDTLYSVSRAHGTTVAALMKENPGVSETNFKAGETIRIPARGTGVEMVSEKVEKSSVEGFKTHVASKDETWNSIAARNNVDVDVLKKVNPGVTKIKNKQSISVPQIVSTTVDTVVVHQDPRELTKEGISEIYNDVHKVAQDIDTTTAKFAIVLESVSEKKDLEFVRGFLTGVDELKRRNYKVDLKVIDGTVRGDSVINQLDEFKPTMVILTADKNIPAFIGEYASVSQTPVVNTFDIRSEEYTSNPYFIQLLSPSNYFNENVAQNVYEKYGDYTLVMAGDQDKNDLLAAALHKFWDPKKVKHLANSSFDGFIAADNEKYLIYGYSTRKDDVEHLLKDVASAKEEHPLSDFLVLGRPNWIVYDASLDNELHNANTLIPTRFYIEDDSAKAHRFSSEYKRLFNRTPAKSIPLYAGVGYDVATYFIPAMADASLDVNKLTSSSNTLQSEFDFERVSNWGGFINPPVYLVHFTPFNTIDKIVIK